MPVVGLYWCASGKSVPTYTTVYNGIQRYIMVYNGIQLVYSWYTVGIWYTMGIQLVYSWYTIGIQLVYSWYTVGIRRYAHQYSPTTGIHQRFVGHISVFIRQIFFKFCFPSLLLNNLNFDLKISTQEFLKIHSLSKSL